MEKSNERLFIRKGNGQVEYRPGSLIKELYPNGAKPSRAVIAVDKLFLGFTTEQEVDDLKEFIFWDSIKRKDLEPAARRKMLSDREVCPCCQQWLGNNHPPEE